MDGKTYSTVEENDRPVRVEFPAGYTEVISLLKAIERSLRHHSRRSFVSIVTPHYVTETRQARRKRYKVEVGNSLDHGRGRRNYEKDDFPIGDFTEDSCDETEARKVQGQIDGVESSHDGEYLHTSGTLESADSARKWPNRSIETHLMKGTTIQDNFGSAFHAIPESVVEPGFTDSPSSHATTNVRPLTRHLTSPTVRVENYDREESPPRSSNSMLLSKGSQGRSISTNNLSPYPQDDSTDDGDYMRVQVRLQPAAGESPPESIAESESEGNDWVPSSILDMENQKEKGKIVEHQSPPSFREQSNIPVVSDPSQAKENACVSPQDTRPESVILSGNPWDVENRERQHQIIFKEDPVDAPNGSSDDDGDVFSVASFTTSATGLSEGSGFTPVQIATAAQELISIFRDDKLLQPLYTAAIRGSIGPHKFANKFRRLLRTYGEELKAEAREYIDNLAARLVMLRAKHITDAIVKRYQEKLPPALTKEFDVQEKPENDSSSEEDEQEDAGMDESVFDELPSFRTFLAESDAFRKLQWSLQQYVSKRSSRDQVPVEQTSLVDNDLSSPYATGNHRVGTITTFPGLSIADVSSRVPETIKVQMVSGSAEALEHVVYSTVIQMLGKYNSRGRLHCEAFAFLGRAVFVTRYGHILRKFCSSLIGDTARSPCINEAIYFTIWWPRLCERIADFLEKQDEKDFTQEVTNPYEDTFPSMLDAIGTHLGISPAPSLADFPDVRRQSMFPKHLKK
jgi:hypothetical protein